MNKIVAALKTINYRLYFAIVFTGLLPTIYTTVRIFYLGDLPGDWGFNIASQMAWVGLIYEVVQEGLILPLFYLLGKSLFNTEEFENKVRTGLFVTFGVYSIISLILIIFTRPLVVLMAQNTDLIDATVSYVRIESVAALFSTLTRFIVLVLVTMKKIDYMYYLLGVQMFMSTLLDTFLVSSLSFSLNIGVNGIAVTNIIVNVTMLSLAILLLRRENVQVIFNKNKPSFDWLKEWYQVGKFSGLESFFRNLAFMVMIIRIVNEVSEQGAYWVANNFIWFWLLLPVLSLGDLVKKEVGEDIDNIRIKTFGYFVLVTIIVVAWLVSIPVWKPFLQYVMNVSEYEKVYGIVTLQLVFYITFAYNSIMDSTFYGVGKTNYMLYQSLIIDVCYYGIAFILYITKAFTPTLTTISLMFGIGMVMDFIPTTLLYRKLLREKIFTSKFELKKRIKQERHTLSDSEPKDIEKQLEGGRITLGVTRIGNTVRRPEKKNSEYISKVLRFLEQKQFKYSQRYLGKDKQKRDVFAYVEGSVPPDLGYTTDLQLHSFMKIVREFHDISMDFVKSDELVLCHDDLSPCNVVFRDDCPWVIIDWDGVHPDERWQDLTYILWLWINIGDHRRKRNIVSRMNKALNVYGTDEKTKQDFSDKLIQRMMRVLDETDMSRSDYERVREWVQDSIRWVEKNKNAIKNEIG